MKNWRGRSGIVRRLGQSSLVCLLALGVSAPFIACSSEPLGSEEQSGTLGLNLEAAPGVTLNAVKYTITGNGFTKSGTIDTSGSPTISGTIGGIPAGKGYTIALSATSLESGTIFSGSATFSVTAGGTTAVTVHLTGSGSTGNGSVSVNGTLNVGPVVDELSVTPVQVYVGSPITLTGVAKDADNGPSPLTYYWSTTGGLIDNPIATNATLTSSTPGTFTVKLTVSDGEITSSAATTVTFVERDAGGEGGAGGDGGEASKRPNVLLIIADDWGAESTSLYPNLVGDSGAVPVPNIEALAENGLVFDNACKPGLLDDARHDRQRSVRLPHRCHVGGRGVADGHGDAVRSHHGREPELWAVLLRQIPLGWRQHRSEGERRLCRRAEDPAARARSRDPELSGHLGWRAHRLLQLEHLQHQRPHGADDHLLDDQAHRSGDRLHSQPRAVEAERPLVHLPGVQRATRGQRREQPVRGPATRAPSRRSQLGRQPEARNARHQYPGLQGQHSGFGHRDWPLAEGGRPREDRGDLHRRQRHARPGQGHGQQGPRLQGQRVRWRRAGAAGHQGRRRHAPGAHRRPSGVERSLRHDLVAYRHRR